MSSEPMGEANRTQLVRSALTLEWVTAAWLLIETGVALGAALAAHSLTLLAFGADSVIELVSAAVLLWRLRVELARGAEFPEQTERIASRIGALLLTTLALYVVASAAWGLWHRVGQHTSLAGLVLAALAIPAMLFLARRKRTLAKALGSAALRADAAESVACAYLSAAVLIGLGAQWVAGAWWIDSVTALVLVPFVAKEALEAWEGEDHDDDEGS